MSTATLLVLATLPAQVYETTSVDRPSQGIGFKIGPFRPGLADEGEIGRYYDLVFSEEVQDGGETEFKNGSEKTRLMYTVDYDYYFFREYGLLGLSGSIGYWTVSGTTRVCPGAPDGSTCLPNVSDDSPQNVFNSERGNVSTRLTLLPMTLGLIYKFDVFKDNTGIPLVPYARGGLSYTYWRSTAGDERSERATVDENGNRQVEAEGAGGQWGVYGTLGLALNVDWLEPGTSRKAANTSGLLDTYLFLEATSTLNDGFSDSRFEFSDLYWQAGLAVDFE